MSQAAEHRLVLRSEVVNAVQHLWVPVVLAMRRLPDQELFECGFPYGRCAITYCGLPANPVVAVERLSLSLIESGFLLGNDQVELWSLLNLHLLTVTVQEDYLLGDIKLTYRRAVSFSELSPPLELAPERSVDQVMLTFDNVNYRGRVCGSRDLGNGLLESDLLLKVSADITLRFLQRRDVPVGSQEGGSRARGVRDGDIRRRRGR